MRNLFFTASLLFLLVASCSSPEPKVYPAGPTTPPETAPTDYRYEVFQHIDSAGKPHGMGYDIYNGSKRIIHQTNIPGEPGIDGFVNDAEAALVAQLVVDKLNKGEGFPTVTRQELQGLGITLKK